jgi:hypothetical protein
VPIETEGTAYDILALLEGGTELWLRPYLTSCVWEEQADELAMRLRFQTQASEPTAVGYLHEILPLGTRLWLYANYGAGFQEVNRFVLTDWGYEDQGLPVFVATCYDDLWYLEDSEWERLYPGDRRAVDILWDIFHEWQIPMGSLTGPVANLSKFPLRGALSAAIGQVLAQAVLAGDEEYFVTMRGGLVHVLQFGTNDTHYLVDSGINSLGMSDHQSIKDLVTEVRVVGNASNGVSEDPAALAELGIDVTQSARYPIEQTVYGHQHFGRLVRIINASSGDTPAMLREEADAIMQQSGEPSRVRTIEAPDFPIRKGDLFYARHGTLNGRYAAVGVVHNADDGTVSLTVDSGGTLQRLKKKVTPAKKTMIADVPELVSQISP